MVRKVLRFILLMIGAGCLVAVCTYFFMNSRQEKGILTDQVRREAPGKFKNLKYGMVHYQLSGQDTSKLIVLLHGGGITGMEVWKENIPFLATRGYRVLAFDLYGRGYTSRPTVKHSSELFAGQLTELLDSLKIAEPFDIVAMSMGAAIALEYANAHKNRVKKIVLIDPAATGDYKANPTLTVPVISDFLLTVIWYPRAIENQRKEFVDKKLFDRYAERLAYFMDFDGYKFTNYSTWMNILKQNKLDEVGSGISNRVLLMYGNQDPYFSAGHASRYSARIQDIKIVKIENAGHMPNYEKAEDANQIVYNFLSEPSGR